MIRLNRTLIAAAIVAAAVWANRAALAELPPGAYESMLKEAQEVLDLKVTKVTPASPPDQSMQNFTVDATVTGVERSKAGLKAGDKIQFGTYLMVRPMPGPMPPPKLQDGWTGKVYLNAPREGNLYDLAAYGRSFVPAGSQGNLPQPGLGPNLGPGGGPAPAPDGPRLGVVARSVPGGGLEILDVSRRALADRLGLRRGDRVLELNGTPVSEAADVPAALAKNSDRLDVKLTRDGDTFELSLKR
jgi:hypothetical protein